MNYLLNISNIIIIIHFSYYSKKSGDIQLTRVFLVRLASRFIIILTESGIVASKIVDRTNNVIEQSFKEVQRRANVIGRFLAEIRGLTAYGKEERLCVTNHTDENRCLTFSSIHCMLDLPEEP